MRTSFTICWLLIAAVASFDTAATSLLHPALKEQEENPVARAILDADNWNFSTFLGLKMFGTCLVLGFLIVANNYKPHHALAIAAALAGFQLLFIFYSFY